MFRYRDFEDGRVGYRERPRGVDLFRSGRPSEQVILSGWVTAYVIRPEVSCRLGLSPHRQQSLIPLSG
jgi:hypothetical protein